MEKNAYNKVKDLLLRGILCLIILLLIVQSGAAQIIYATNDSIRARKDFIDILRKVTKWDEKNRKSRDDKKVFLSLMPVSGGSSEKGVTISSVNAAFFMGPREITNLSNITFYPTTNFSSYFTFEVLPNLWLKGNSWNIPGKFQYSYTQQKTYGLGTNTVEDSLVIVNHNTAIAHLIINKEVLPDFFLGAGYYLDYFYNISQEWDKDYPSSFERYEYGNSSESLSSGVALNILYDTRKNSINALQGIYSNLTFVINNPILGSDYTWKSLYFDSRQYFNFSTARHKVLALREIFWGTWGEVPYLNLPGTRLGPATWTGRGYIRGRYRGQHMIYGEAEYRFDVTRNGLWGGVLFVNGESFSEPDIIRFKYVKPAAGFGVRLKFNKFSDSNITSDLAFGKGSVVWFVGLNEVF
jgi:hypothetical protein